MKKVVIIILVGISLYIFRYTRIFVPVYIMEESNNKILVEFINREDYSFSKSTWVSKDNAYDVKDTPDGMEYIPIMSLKNEAYFKDVYFQEGDIIYVKRFPALAILMLIVIALVIVLEIWGNFKPEPFNPYRE